MKTAKTKHISNGYVLLFISLEISWKISEAFLMEAKVRATVAATMTSGSY